MKRWRLAQLSELRQKLRRLAFAESVPAPQIQLELDLQAPQSQGELEFDDEAGELDVEGPDDE